MDIKKTGVPARADDKTGPPPGQPRQPKCSPRHACAGTVMSPASADRLLFEDAFRAVEDGRIVQRYHAAVGPRLEMHAPGIAALEMASPGLSPHYLYICAQFIGDTLGTAARKLVLDTAQLIKGYCHSSMV